jgi:hypothetical protein
MDGWEVEEADWWVCIWVVWAELRVDDVGECVKNWE